MNVDFFNVYLAAEEHGCMYTVCTEGELFYAPMYRDGTVNLEEFDFVDMDTMDEKTAKKCEEIQSTLIEMMQCAGLYFRQPALV